MQYGIGIIGCGMISRFHARAASEIDNLRLVGCTSHSPESAAKLASEMGCKCYQSLGELLQDPEIQIVAICTPSGDHLDPLTRHRSDRIDLPRGTYSPPAIDGKRRRRSVCRWFRR